MQVPVIWPKTVTKIYDLLTGKQILCEAIFTLWKCDLKKTNSFLRKVLHGYMSILYQIEKALLFFYYNAVSNLFINNKVLCFIEYDLSIYFYLQFIK